MLRLIAILRTKGSGVRIAPGAPVIQRVRQKCLALFSFLHDFLRDYSGAFIPKLFPQDHGKAAIYPTPFIRDAVFLLGVRAFGFVGVFIEPMLRRGSPRFRTEQPHP